MTALTKIFVYNHSKDVTITMNPLTGTKPQKFQ